MYLLSQPGACNRLPGLPRPPFAGGAGSAWRRRGSLYCILFSGICTGACCHHSLCELSVGVLHENFPSLCGVICLPGPISAHILWNIPWKAIFLFWSRSKIIHMMKCRQDACGEKKKISQSFQWNEMVGRCKQNLTKMKPFSVSSQSISHRVELGGTLAGTGHHSARLHTARPGSSRHTQDV